jgi:hypothetical protein
MLIHLHYSFHCFASDSHNLLPLLILQLQYGRTGLWLTLVTLSINSSLIHCPFQFICILYLFCRTAVHISVQCCSYQCMCSSFKVFTFTFVSRGKWGGKLVCWLHVDWVYSKHVVADDGSAQLKSVCRNMCHWGTKSLTWFLYNVIWNHMLR